MLTPSPPHRGQSTAVERVLERLAGRVWPHQLGWVGRCPTHHWSLSLFVSDDPFSLVCFEGCEVPELLRSLGLTDKAVHA